MRSSFATIRPTKGFRAFLENHLSSLFSYQGSYNKPEQREGQHDFSTSDVHSGGSQRWQLQWIRRKHSPRHGGKPTEFYLRALIPPVPPFFLRGLSCPSHERRLSAWQVIFKCCVAHQNKPPLSIQVGAMILCSQLQVWIDVWNEPAVCVCCTRRGNSRVNRDTHRGG